MERIYFKTVEMLEAYGGGKGQNILNIQKSFVPVKLLSWWMPHGLWHLQPSSNVLEATLLGSF